MCFLLSSFCEPSFSFSALLPPHHVYHISIVSSISFIRPLKFVLNFFLSFVLIVWTLFCYSSLRNLFTSAFSIFSLSLSGPSFFPCHLESGTCKVMLYFVSESQRNKKGFAPLHGNNAGIVLLFTNLGDHTNGKLI